MENQTGCIDILNSTKIILHSGTEVLHYHFADIIKAEASMLEFFGYQIKQAVSSYDLFYIDPETGRLWQFIGNDRAIPDNKRYEELRDLVENGEIEKAKKLVDNKLVRYYDRTHVRTNLKYSISEFV